MTQWEYESVMRILDGGAPAISGILAKSIDAELQENQTLKSENEKLKAENTELKKTRRKKK